MENQSKKHTSSEINVEELKPDELNELMNKEAEKIAQKQFPDQLTAKEKQETEEFKRKFFERTSGLSTRREPTEKELEYWKKINEDPAEIDRETFKILLWKAMQRYLPKDDEGRSVFEKDGNIVQVINDLIDYFLGLDGKYSPDKGIYLWGNVELGKTITMRSFGSVLSRLRRYEDMRVVALKDIYLDMTKYKDTEVLEKYKTGQICFDDLGFESPTVNVYGNKINVFEELIHKRYAMFQAYGQITHVTSNVSPEEDGEMVTIEEAYGDRIASRCNHMFHFVELFGKGKRK